MKRDWHTEIGVPATLLPEYASPGVTLLLLGFGKRDFMLAREPGIADYLAGPLPGPGAMEVIGLAEAPSSGIVLRVTTAGLSGLAAGLRGSFAPGPVLIEMRQDRRYYAASRGYTRGYTCNTWTAEMLALAGLDVRPDGVVLAGGVMRQVLRLPEACRLG